MQNTSTVVTSINAGNCKPLTTPIQIFLADFPIGSAEFELMKKRFKHPKAAMLLQHLEFLNRKFGLPINGVYRNIKPCGSVPSNKTISGHIGITSPRILYPLIAEIRKSYDFQKGVKLIPSAIDFEGKLYASYYSRNPDDRTVSWFRNAALINQLVDEIQQELREQMQAKNLIYVVPREPLSEAYDGVASELSGEPSYIDKELELSKNEKEKEKNSLKLVSFSIDKTTSKTSEKNKHNIDVFKVKESSSVLKGDTCDNKIVVNIYSSYKAYCISRDENYLMPDIPTSADVQKLKKFAQLLYELGFKQNELPHFFSMLGSEHHEILNYLKAHGVWQVKNFDVFFSIAFLEKYPNQFASWYKKKLINVAQTNELIQNSVAKYSNTSPVDGSPNEPEFILKSPGYTYQDSMLKSPENERESREYLCVFIKRSNPETDWEKLYDFQIRKNAIDLEASDKRIKLLSELTLEEFENLPFPR